MERDEREKLLFCLNNRITGLHEAIRFKFKEKVL